MRGEDNGLKAALEDEDETVQRVARAVLQACAQTLLFA